MKHTITIVVRLEVDTPPGDPGAVVSLAYGALCKGVQDYTKAPPVICSATATLNAYAAAEVAP